MNIDIEISLGEFFDKLTILQIKQDKITDADKLENINKELAYLIAKLENASISLDVVAEEFSALRKSNEALWEIEDAIRIKEGQGEFDQAFIELARSVYVNNDERAEIKRTINQKLGSNFVEEKSYASYERDVT
ncbi:MAG: hypothetical protein CMJ81_24385 [Planctomycetaceae bacterium]|nr:hypothetical protein [Planctomycetaceae bacterium]MBP60694.1 hypothetical protein [Planctomycetaceae bacterium]